MLCLSGFELYPRWVPLIHEIKTPDQKTYLENLTEKLHNIDENLLLSRISS